MNQATLDELVEEATWMRRLARSLIRDDAGADDLVQDTGASGEPVLDARVRIANDVAGTDQLGTMGAITTTVDTDGNFSFRVPAGAYELSVRTGDADEPVLHAPVTTGTRDLRLELL